MSTDRELLELAAKAVGGKAHEPAFDGFPKKFTVDGFPGWFNPLEDDAQALRLAVQLRINILFSGGRHHVGLDRFVMDVCREGGMSEIRYGIVRAAAEIGRSMP